MPVQSERQGKFTATVLVIDDDPEMRAMLKHVLEREGLRVLEESSGAGAIAVVESARLDAVILDKEMPGVGGFDLLAFLRRRCPETPVIVITAFGGPRAAKEALRLGAARYLEKPFRVAQLLEALRAVVKGGTGQSSAQGGPYDRGPICSKGLPSLECSP